MCACDKDEPTPSDNEFPITITATIKPLVSTKAIVDGINVRWEEGDKLGLFEREGAVYKNSNIELSLFGGAGNSTATFTGYASSNDGWSVNDKIFMAYYPYSNTQMMASELFFSTSASQIQDINNPEAHLTKNNCMVSKSEISASNDVSQASIIFTPLLTRLDFVIVNETNTPLTLGGVDYRSMVGENIFYDKGKYNLRDLIFEHIPTDGCDQYSVSLSDSVKVSVGGNYKVSMLVFPTSIPQNTGIILGIKNSRKNIEQSIYVIETNGLDYISGNAYQKVVTLSESTFAQSEIITLPGNQNTFVVKPPQYEGMTSQFLIPITRVNTYWGADYANIPSNKIENDTKWVADIIWKDVDVTGDASLIKLTANKHTGTGPLGSIGIDINYDNTEPFGNAVIGIRKADANFNPVGDYLWSWHIWVSDYNGELQDYSGTNGFKMMDRNLGAKNNTKGDIGALGLLYQWGRKDPFVGASATFFPEGSEITYATTTHNWPSPVSFNVGGTMNYAVQHPTVFITSEDAGIANPMKSDWMQTPDSYLWSNSTKTIYDPCPKGYKVASRRSWESLNADNFVFDNINNGRSYGDVWYPAAGARRGEDAILRYVGTHGYAVWSSGSATQTVSGVLNYFARTMYYYNTDTGSGLDVDYRSSRAHGATVRCVEWEDDQ